ncbi:MAG: hypothetical protein F6K53_33440 [Moorea sp. SIO4A1]|nr:hypothetical protein [Moorena sp. SIO4A1]
MAFGGIGYLGTPILIGVVLMDLVAIAKGASVTGRSRILTLSDIDQKLLYGQDQFG